MFHFKQFNVDQSGCAMKINTDGVLLGALTDADQPQNILDIGTGTGVIALMLAQRFSKAEIDAVEIDITAAETAGNNFNSSAFADRLNIYALSFEDFFEQHPGKKYDLIVSNPPFYINSLKSPKAGKQLAKHADEQFFRKLLGCVSKHIDIEGLACLILPLDTAELIKNIALKNGLFVKKTVSVYSYKDSVPHREILVLSSDKTKTADEQFVIYEAPKFYSEQYQEALKNFFTIF